MLLCNGENEKDFPLIVDDINMGKTGGPKTFGA